MSCSLCGEVCCCVPRAKPAEKSGLETGVPESVFGVVNASSARGQESLLPGQDGSSWRQEVSDRLNRYHARRRPRPPRYPSLRLKFEQPESRWAASDPVAQSPSVQASQASPVMRQAVAVNYVEPTPERASPPATWTAEVALPLPERPRNQSAGNLIEFPRTIYTPVVRADDLAETILDRPRILEAPEIVPPPPALGGMTIEEIAKPGAGTASWDRHAAAIGIYRAKVLGGFNRWSAGTGGRCSVRSNLLQGREPGADACTNCRRGEPVCWSLVGERISTCS